MGEISTGKGSIRELRHQAQRAAPELQGVLRGVQGMGSDDQITRLQEALNLVNPEAAKARLAVEFASAIAQVDHKYTGASDAIKQAISIVQARAEAQAIAAMEADLLAGESEYEGSKAKSFADNLRELGWSAEITSVKRTGAVTVKAKHPEDESKSLEIVWLGKACQGGYGNEGDRSRKLHTAARAFIFAEQGIQAL